MTRKLISILLSLVLLSCCIAGASALEYSQVIDNARLLLPEEIAYLEETAANIREQYGINAVILTADSLMGMSAQNYADNYYDNAGYSENGILFLLAMEEREWYISTSGSMIYTLTDYGIQQIGESVVPYLSEGLWFEGFCSYLFSLPKYLDAYQHGAPIDGYADYSEDYYHGDQEEILYYKEEFTPNFGLSLLCGLVAAGISVLVMRFSMNTKREQRCASVYMDTGSWKITHQRDMFLYSNVTKTRRQEHPSGGGSSVHRSSGGRSHGGGGGKF